VSRAAPKSKHRYDQQRILIAQEAARIIHETGLSDYRLAKLKAAENLGLNQKGALPSNTEIEAAVAEHGRIFHEETQLSILSLQRETAVFVMQKLTPFRPRLVGAVLSGNITEHSPVELHLYSDTCEAVDMLLNAQGILYQSGIRKHSIQKGKPEAFPHYKFSEEGFPVHATVFPEKRSQHAPLSQINGKPMQRADVRDVEMLLLEAQPVGYC